MDAQLASGLPMVGSWSPSPHTFFEIHVESRLPECKTARRCSDQCRSGCFISTSWLWWLLAWSMRCNILLMWFNVA